MTALAGVVSMIDTVWAAWSDLLAAGAHVDACEAAERAALASGNAVAFIAAARETARARAAFVAARAAHDEVRRASSTLKRMSARTVRRLDREVKSAVWTRIERMRRAAALVEMRGAADELCARDMAAVSIVERGRGWTEIHFVGELPDAVAVLGSARDWPFAERVALVDVDGVDVTPAAFVAEVDALRRSRCGCVDCTYEVQA